MDHRIQEWVKELPCNVGAKRNISALIFQDEDMDWVFKQFLPAVREWHECNFGNDGTLLSLLTRPISKSDTTEVFSAVVHGRHLSRMEWVSLDLVYAALNVLDKHRQDECSYWETLKDKFALSSRSDLWFRVGIAPHKMRLMGDDLEASAPGAGKRADFLLLAFKSGEQHPYVLGFAYHTTNAVPETSSGDKNQAHPETRVLWYMHVQLPGLMEEAATSFAKSLGLPEPRQPRDKKEVAKILDENTWVDTVLKPLDATMDDETCHATTAAATMSDSEDDDAETCAGGEENSNNLDNSDNDSDKPDWEE